MKQLFLTFYNALNVNEKRTFWYGSIAFTIGFIMLTDALIPPSWRGFQETQGEILGIENAPSGAFSGGSTTYLLQYQPQNGQILRGTFRISPIILTAMGRIRVFYKSHEPTFFYVHNPTLLVIASTMVIFGGGVLVTFFMYYRDGRRGVRYD